MPFSLIYCIYYVDKLRYTHSLQSFTAVLPKGYYLVCIVGMSLSKLALYTISMQSAACNVMGEDIFKQHPCGLIRVVIGTLLDRIAILTIIRISIS